jgi:hypothetical protein
MIEFTISIEGIDVLLAKMKATLPAVIKGLEEGAWEAYHDVQMYTGDTRGIPQNWVSERQRRFVMASIREGTINVPYNRTGQLAAGWGGGAKQTAPLEYAIGPNPVSYGPFVIGSGTQTAQHISGGWEKYDARNQERLNRTLMRIKYHLDMAYG